MLTDAQIRKLKTLSKAITWNFEHSKDIRQRMEKHLLPSIGNTPLEEITPMKIITAIYGYTDK